MSEADYKEPSWPIRRVRYFANEFLIDQDFIDDQNFQTAQRHRQDALLVLPGIASGLEVSVSATGLDIQLGSGGAFDANGCQAMVMPVDDDRDGPGQPPLRCSGEYVTEAWRPTADRKLWTSNFSATVTTDGDYILYIAFYEVGTGDAQQSGAGVKGENRFQQQAIVDLANVANWPNSARVPATPSGLSSQPLKLAHVTVLTEAGVQRFDLDLNVRRYSGSILPGPPSQSSYLRTHAGSPPTTKPILEIGGAGGVTLGALPSDPEADIVPLLSVLEADKSTNVNGLLSVTGNTKLTGELQINSGLRISGNSVTPTGSSPLALAGDLQIASGLKISGDGVAPSSKTLTLDGGLQVKGGLSLNGNTISPANGQLVLNQITMVPGWRMSQVLAGVEPLTDYTAGKIFPSLVDEGPFEFFTNGGAVVVTIQVSKPYVSGEPARFILYFRIDKVTVATIKGWCGTCSAQITLLPGNANLPSPARSVPGTYKMAGQNTKLEFEFVLGEDTSLDQNKASFNVNVLELPFGASAQLPTGAATLVDDVAVGAKSIQVTSVNGLSEFDSILIGRSGNWEMLRVDSFKSDTKTLTLHYATDKSHPKGTTADWPNYFPSTPE